MDSANLLAEARDRYGEALVLGESAPAWAVIEQALGRGLSRAEIYLEVLAQSQIRLGELWHEGSINVAQEHLATTITMEVMDHLRQGMAPRTGLGVRAVVTPVEGDQHYLGARMIADFLAMDGWEVDFLREWHTRQGPCGICSTAEGRSRGAVLYSARVPAECQRCRRRDSRTELARPEDSAGWEGA